MNGLHETLRTQGVYLRFYEDEAGNLARVSLWARCADPVPDPMLWQWDADLIPPRVRKQYAQRLGDIEASREACDEHDGETELERRGVDWAKADERKR